MTELTRRDALKTATIAAAVASGAGAPLAAAEGARPAIPSDAATAYTLRHRERLLFDFGWRFHFGHAADYSKDFNFGKLERTFAKAGRNIADCTEAKFKDADWETVDLPHDWLAGLPSVPSKNPPPPKKKDYRAAHGFKPVGRDYPETSVGWYRRWFDVAESDLGKSISLEFDGVYRDCMVVVNGHMAYQNEGGTAPFRVEIGDFLEYGKRNLICIRVDATLSEGWFYEGAGIYRHVWLVKTDPLHIPQWGTWVRSDVKGKTAHLTIETEIRNDALTARQATLVSEIFAPDGKRVASLKSPLLQIGSQSTRTCTQAVAVNTPALWSVDTPNLYRMVSRLEAAGKAVDDYVTPFGIRTLRFDAETGFYLNGAPLKIKGTANHQDHSGVGVAFPDRLHDWRIAQLREMGSNGYRTTHNEASNELLDACDRLGMLVMDEARLMSSDAGNMDEFARTLRRDRNHPSIILWAIGNEEPLQGTPRGARMAEKMRAQVRSLDPTRPITECNHEPKTWGIGITPYLDVLGCNYYPEEIAAYHAKYPKMPILCSETASTVCTRGFYTRNPESGYCVAYDLEFPEVSSTAEFWMKIVMPARYIAGGYVWSGFDYHGEPTPYNWWPNVSAQFGIFDMCGFPKDNFHYYKAWWGQEPVLHILPHWNWAPGQSVKVWCHSNLDQVELFVNGQSLGRRDVPRFGHAEWDAVFAPGTLTAHGYRDGKKVMTATRETAGPPAALRLTADRTVLSADGEDIAVIAATVVDAQGRPVPGAAHEIRFSIEGAAKILGVGNGDPKCNAPEKADTRAAFDGLCQALIQVGRVVGPIVVNAAASGLQPARVNIAAQACHPRAFVP